ncbi:MAG: 50S ribosomal protein L30 [Chloroflexi bacterium]|jgi:large subunit ribosomal protein L30|nr:50S ribosomal protein L30 [Chloroflexota bacterium]
MPKKIRITYVRSAIGRTERQKRTIRTLGLRRLGDSVEHDDRPEVRGMVASVSHLVEVEEVAP